MNVVLFGFMGTGKTTIGKRLAQRLGWTCMDMDEILEQREGRSIADIFATDGEAHFRMLEKDLAAELAHGTRQVISTGGGVVLDPENVRRFQASGFCVCLHADEDTILRRVAAKSHRPLLEQGDKAARIRALLHQRKPLYDQIEHQIDTVALSEDKIVEELAGITGRTDASVPAPPLSGAAGLSERVKHRETS